MYNEERIFRSSSAITLPSELEGDWQDAQINLVNMFQQVSKYTDLLK